ncbi:Flp pilus assembly protein CpaB [Paraburkholderia sp. EB58]|jgi:pilus assembly protein CpaB|uniref:SAF domain-containing protein n=1 Tax=Paraburkholderia sp. EB58 TaxID=3035125 RepID=UPI003D1952CA
MKNIKWMGTLALTAAGTLVAVLCASRWVPAQTASAARIAVASVDIDVGQRLTPRFIKLIDCPTGKIPPGAFSDPHKLDGRVLRASVLHGEPLTESGLQPLALSAVRLHPGDLVAPAAARG